jgi:hypothetical protein
MVIWLARSALVYLVAMIFVAIYGEPGVGKLAVARELGRHTGLKVLHNHLTIEVGLAIFEFGSKELTSLLDKLRLTVIEEAAAHHVDVVATFAFVSSPQTDPEAERFLGRAEGFGARVCLVQLVCDQSVQEERISSPERAELGKLVSIDALREYMGRIDRDRSIPGRETLTIDNTRLPPEEVAWQIATHFGLPFRGQ